MWLSRIWDEIIEYHPLGNVIASVSTEEAGETRGMRVESSRCYTTSRNARLEAKEAGSIAGCRLLQNPGEPVVIRRAARGDQIGKIMLGVQGASPIPRKRRKAEFKTTGNPPSSALCYESCGETDPDHLQDGSHSAVHFKLCSILCGSM